MMKRNPLLKNADELLALGETVAAVLAENQKRWDIPTEVEAVLRARIAAAAFAIDADVAVLAGSHKSSVAMSHLAEAKSRADRSIRQWSRRVLRSVAQLRRRMSGREFARAAGMSIRMESVRNSGAPESRVRPHSIRFSKVWGGGGRPSLVDARLDPCFFTRL